MSFPVIKNGGQSSGRRLSRCKKLTGNFASACGRAASGRGSVPGGRGGREESHASPGGEAPCPRRVSAQGGSASVATVASENGFRKQQADCQSSAHRSRAGGSEPRGADRPGLGRRAAGSPGPPGRPRDPRTGRRTGHGKLKATLVSSVCEVLAGLRRLLHSTCCRAADMHCAKPQVHTLHTDYYTEYRHYYTDYRHYYTDYTAAKVRRQSERSFNTNSNLQSDWICEVDVKIRELKMICIDLL